MKLKEVDSTQNLDIEIIFNSIHNIDLKSEIISPVKLDDNSDDIKDYFKLLIKGIRDSKNTRTFEFKEESNQKNEFLNIIQTKTSQLIADKLFKEEKEAQKRYSENFTKVQKGSLLHDKVIQNGALFYLISKLELLVQEKQFIENKNELNKLIDNEISSITSVLCNLPKIKKIELIIDYYFHIQRNDEIANKLNEELINFSGNLTEIIKNRIEINNPYAFTKLIPLLSRDEFKDLFQTEFFNWFKNDFNNITWNQIKENVINALDNNIIILDKLNNLKLFISDFDKQTRYSKYIKDFDKLEAINFLLNTNLKKAS